MLIWFNEWWDFVNKLGFWKVECLAISCGGSENYMSLDVHLTSTSQLRRTCSRNITFERWNVERVIWTHTLKQFGWVWEFYSLANFFSMKINIHLNFLGTSWKVLEEINCPQDNAYKHMLMNFVEILSIYLNC